MQKQKNTIDIQPLQVRIPMVFSFGGSGWIRTIVAIQQQIYSLPPLAAREHSHIFIEFKIRWSWWTDSNPRPADYKSAALPTELHQRVRCSLINCPTARNSIAGERGIVKHFRKKSFFFFRGAHRGGKAARFAAASAGPSGPMGGVLPPVRGGEL